METIDYLKEILNNHKEELGFNSIMVLSGKEKEDKRQKIEQELNLKDIVIITKAGRASRNLQRANNLVMYNTPYSLSDFLQCPCKGTKILTDLGYINVEDLPQFFNVLIRGNTYKAEKLGIKKSKVLEVVFTTGFSIKVSEDHQFLDTVDNWIQAKYLFSGKHLALYFSEPTSLEVPDSLEVSHVNYLSEEEDTYLISVDSEEHAYVTDNLISHNCSGRICRVDTTYSQQHFYILEVEKTIDTYRIALFKDHLSLLDRLLGKECRGTLTCDYVEIDRMKMKDLKKSLLWRTR